MTFQKLTEESLKYFPELKIKYKNQSIFMKILGIILFFNKKFMTDYITTIGSTVYFPSEEYTKQNQVVSCITLLHELIHINDSKKINRVLFSFLYLFPQSLILFCLPLLFISWKVGLLLILLLLLPLPAYFRMYFERRAYISSLYVYKTIADRVGSYVDYEKHKEFCVKQFNTSVYYFMWMFKGIEKNFDDAIVKVNEGNKPYDDEVLNIVADLSKYI